MTTHGGRKLKDWVESKRASAFPGPNTEVDPETDPALQGIPRVGDEILNGKYTVEHVIGIGGMGVVCSAVHKQLKQRVAIKFLSGQMRSQELVDRFIREGQAAVRIKSEHIATVLDVGVLENGTPYLMMEHLAGADLSDYLLERKSLPIEEAVDFVLQALDALAVAHNAGVIHRDLKPSNLFVTQRADGSPLVKVLDFGISKITEAGPSPTATLTRPGMMLGSPRYMSPEQLRNASSVDHRADIWAMGIVLQELLSGRPPFDADTFTALCTAIVSDAPTPLRSLVPDAPEELEHIVQKCLERKADDRFQNVAELAQALAPFAPEDSRHIATRISKTLGQIPNKTPPGGYTSTKVSAGTPKPNQQRTLPLADPNSVRPSVPSPMASTGDPAGSSANPGALAISTAKPAAARRKLPLAIGAAFIVGLAATAFVATRKHDGPIAATPASASAATTATAIATSAEPAPAPAPAPTPSATTAPTVETVTAKAATSSVASVPPARPKPIAAKPSAAPSAAATAAQPTEEELLNRRR
jgi:serine/threonine-protein kinase